MAKKSKTNLKQAKLQTKLLLLFAIIFAGIGIYLVSTSFAAKGGKGKPGSGTTVYVDSPYGIKADPSVAKYGSAGNLYVTDINGQTLSSLPENFRTSGQCYYNGTLVGSWSNDIPMSGYNLYQVGLINSTFSNGATCTGYLQVLRNGSWQNTASTTFTVVP